MASWRPSAAALILCTLPGGRRVRDLALGIVQLMQYGWPPAFIAMYDEAWQLAQEVSLLMKVR